MKPTEIANIRLTNQQLGRTKFGTGQELVEWFGAVQGQEYVQTKWGLGLRLPGVRDSDIEEELTAGKILRTHLLRPTWHFVSANDIRWLLLLTAPRVQQVNGYMYRKLELTASVFNKCNDIMVELLEGNNHLTRHEINEELERHGILAEGHRLSYIMMNAELEGIICSGPRRGKQFTYALFDERVPASTVPDKDEALAELTKRYFTSRGPATVYDFSTWSGLTVTACRKGVKRVKNLLAEEMIDDTQYYFLPGRSNNKRTSKSVYLLPIYDELLIGYKDREAFMQFKKTVSPEPEMIYDNTIVYEGQITGTWKRTINRSSIDLFYRFFKHPDQTQWNLFQKAVQRFEAFNGMAVQIWDK